MAAIIRSTVAPVAHPITGVARGTVTGASRDDLYLGDAVTVTSVDAATTYAWTLVYVPEGSTATFSGDPTTAAPGSFTLDLEGPYLVRLTVNLGLPTENTQMVRLRWLTEFAQLKIVAAGEENNSGIPVPVDQTPDGWTNDQNFNFLTLTNFLAKVSSAGRILYVDQNGSPTDNLRGYGDYDNIQDAIDAAIAQTPTVAAPWVVAVRPGLYTEDLAFAPHVHVYGWPGSTDGDAGNRVVRIRNDTVAHTVTLASASDQVFLSGLTFENPLNGTDAVITKAGIGTLHIYGCALTNQGTDASQGPALLATGGLTLASRSQFILDSAAGATQPAILVTVGGTTVNLDDCLVTGPDAMVLEASTTVLARDTQFTGLGAGGLTAGILTDGSSLTLEYCTVRAPLVTFPLQAHTSAGVLAGALGLAVRWTRIEGGILYTATGVVGISTLQLGSVEYTSLLVAGTPDTFEALVKAKTLFYDNTVSGLVAEDVQDAIDELEVLATAVRTLDDAYDAGGGGPGTGRTIVADSGAVQIIGSGTPTDPPPVANTDGQIQVVSNVQVGAIGGPEIDIDPNPYGNGPTILMGRFVAANNTPFGSTAMLLGRSTGFPDFNNYNLRLQTETSLGGSLIGRVIVSGGDALDNGGSTPTPGPVFIQGGSAFGGTTDGGGITVIPGESTGGTEGYFILGKADTMTPATLTASGAFVGGVAGTIRFATNMGAIEVPIGSGDGLAAVLALFNTTGHVTAIDSGGGVIELTSVAKGPNAEIHFLNDTAGGTLDTALGGFDGVAQISGTMPDSIKIRVSADQTIEFGVDGASGPMIYDADAGKLTVPVTVDPRYYVYDETIPLVPPAGKGATYVGDGSGGTTLGDLYYNHALGGQINLSGIAANKIDAEDEGTPLGSFKTFNFTGAGVTAIDAGGSKLTVNIPGGGGGGGGGVAREEFLASSFVPGPPSTKALGSTPDLTASRDGVFDLLRNGVSDMTRVGGAPSASNEWRISGTTLEIGTNITGSSHIFEVVYPI